MRCLVVLLLLLPTVLLAEPRAALDRLPPGLLAELEEGPEAFVERVAGLIFAYGHDAALRAGDLEVAVAHARARARARAVLDLLGADLDGDGRLAPDEITRTGPALSPNAQGLLVTRARRADTDADGTVSPAEIDAYAAARAARAMGPTRAKGLRDLMLLDVDGDGRVILAEVMAVARAARPEA